ncbi:MAG: class I SAM-dependent methyltransferase [Methanobacterium sp.]|nr:class I SAM-dependent methyltransferase [Methanobacterium sp.]
MDRISFDSYIKSFEVFGQYSEEYGYQLDHLLALEDSLKEGFSILDIGAGTGFFIRDFLKRCRINPSHYTAIEPSKDHVNKLKRNLDEFSLELNAYNNIFTPETVLDRKFDLIIMSHSLYWFLPDPEPYILNALKFMENNGRLVMYLQTPYTASHILNLLFDKKLPKNRAPSHEINSWAVMDILDKNNIKYEISNLPGTFRANDIFKKKNQWILNKVISFFFAVEAGSLDEKIKSRAEEAMKMLSYKQGNDLKLNMEVGAITVY